MAASRLGGRDPSLARPQGRSPLRVQSTDELGGAKEGAIGAPLGSNSAPILSPRLRGSARLAPVLAEFWLLFFFGWRGDDLGGVGSGGILVFFFVLSLAGFVPWGLNSRFSSPQEWCSRCLFWLICELWGKTPPFLSFLALKNRLW